MKTQSIKQTSAMSVFERNRRIRLWIGLTFVLVLHGCAAFHPVNGVPAAYVPEEYLGPSRSGKKTINLSLLEQRRPDQYRLAAGDVLSVYVPGVLGSLSVSEQKTIGETPPINLPQNPIDLPTIGYPVAVRDDGTISLPLVPPVNVDGKTLAEAENEVRRAYTVDAKLLNDERDRVLISLSRRREYSILVVRQETSNDLAAGGQPGTVNIGKSKRGTAKVVRLPAYENDVLHALAKAEGGADGLPGLDAKNTIYIIRRRSENAESCPVRSREAVELPLAQPTPALTMPAPSLGPSFDRPFTSGNSIQSLPIPNAVGHPPSPDQSSSVPLSNPSVTPGSMSVQPPHRVRVQPQQSDAAGEPDENLQRVPVDSSSIPNRLGGPPLPGEPAQQPLLQAEPEPQDTSPEPQPSQPPIWPQPANPAESLRRTSSPRSKVWGHSSQPIVRGQSPSSWGLGHSDSEMSSRGVGSVPYDGRAIAQYQTFGHGEAGDPSAQMNLVHPEMYSAVPPGGNTNGPAIVPPTPIGGIPSHWNHSLGEGEDVWEDQLYAFDPTVDNPNVIKIPIRLAEGERPAFTEKDIILQDGDIVFIESRETEVFYTGGLLGGGQYTLPRDYDLRIIEAISIAQSAQTTQGGNTRAIGGVSALNMDVTFSASHVVVLRQLPNGTRMPIKVDLYKAVRRPESENIIIQPGDMLILQYTKLEAVCALVERHLFEGALFGIAAAQLQNNGN